MKAKFLLFILALTTILSLAAVEPVAKLLVSMPDSLIPSIEVNRRKDLIDLFHAGQHAQAATKLDGTATLTEMKDNMLSITLSPKSKMEMRIYPTHNNDSIITLINTVYAPAGNSRIRVFDPSWNELPVSKYIRPIPTAEFFTIPDTLAETQKKELLQIRLQLDDDLTIQSILSSASDEWIRPFVFAVLIAADTMRGYGISDWDAVCANASSIS